ncbi:hypothetical protein [Amycolatopsis benzoatilytica]|uniref:hypothetical protein n=1 Tax=Amycolatopsis benzoatilytica TaxID=346045 RepID=UPI0003791987|nr:hypothetical protein [Amycolatopsis benzoatilytica]
MPRKPTPPPPELDDVRAVADLLALAEQLVETLREERNHRIAIAKLAGATGDQLAEAAQMTRRNATTAAADGGLGEPGWVDDPDAYRAAILRRLEGRDADSRQRRDAIMRRLRDAAADK